jgi:hypothetical protein
MSTATSQPVSLSSNGPAVKDLRARTLQLAQELGRLGSAAMFLSNIRQSLGEDPVELIRIFDRSRQAMRELQPALQNGCAEEANRRLASLSENCNRLRAVIFDVEESVTERQVETYLKQANEAGTDLLRRMIEFYARSSPRDAAHRSKMIAIAAALARRAGFTAGELGRIGREFYRLELLKDLPGPYPDQSVLTRIDGLRERLTGLCSESDAKPASPAEEVRALESELGDSLYSVPGLCEAVSLRLAVHETNLALEHSQVRSYDTLVDDLEGVFQEEIVEQPAAEPAEVQEAAGDDPAARELLEQTGRELLEAAANGDPSEQGFHLDPIEIEAAKSLLEDKKRESLIVRAATWRSAVDRLARRHARSHRPEGVEPEPVPRGTALTIMEEASCLERELQDQIKHDVVHGEADSKTTMTRCYQRLSRSRLGLAILAGRNGNGEAQEGGAQEGEALRGQIRTAYLVRSALTENRKPKAKAKRGGLSALKRLPPRTVFLALLGASAVAAAVFHLTFWRSDTPMRKPPQTHFAAPAPLKEVLPLKETLFVRADVAWGFADDSRREDYVRTLWSDVAKQGYNRLVVVDGTDSRPLAVATQESVKVFPSSSTAAAFPPKNP